MGLETLAIASLASGALGTGFSVVSSMEQSSNQRKQAQYQAQIAENNAKIATQNAKDTEAAGRAAEQRQRIENSQILGQQRAQAGASGLDVGSDTLANDFAATTAIGEADALNVRNNYQREANSYYNQAANYSSQSGLYSSAASNSGGLLDSSGSLLSGASKVAGSWYSFKKDLS